ncbi:MAG: PilN domain-containing protein [Acidobacteria bacterium]|nr:PilN domain-containing protein [Acidobacteriota bacterium]
MRISVNLATRPFVELRPLFAKLRLVAVGLALLAVVLGLTLRSLNARARTAEAQMNALKARTLGYQQERQRNEARMRQPQNMAVLERSQFLNALFAAKSFSWTAVMMDLERVLPSGVQVTSIEPATSKTGEVSIRLRVSGDRDRTVELVRNLEHSQRFINPRIATEQTQAQETSGRVGFQPAAPGAVEFDILSGYNPLATETARASKDAAKEDTAASDAATSATPLTAPRRARGAKAAPPKQRHLIGGAR